MFEFESEIKSISFEKANFEDEIAPKLQDCLGDYYQIIELAQQIYSWYTLYKVCSGRPSVSHAKVEDYEKHKEQLSHLKVLVRKHFSKNVYREIFRKEDDKIHNYVSYISGKKDRDEFYKYLKKTLEKKSTFKKTSEFENISRAIEQQNYLPKQRVKDNSVVPQQLYKQEIVKILNNLSSHYPFLSQKTDGISNREKIIKIFEYRIPYYVGPLCDIHRAGDDGFSWLVRDCSKKITPWNFEQVVDIPQSAENFIKNMTRKCTYLKQYNVLPKNSLLYSEYSVLNELNNVRIKTKKLTPKLKEKMLNTLFRQKKNISITSLIHWLVSEGVYEKGEIEKSDVSGVDSNFTSSLSAAISFDRIIGEKMKNKKTQKMVEEIINWLALFSDKKILQQKIVEKYQDKVSQEQIGKILRLNLSGWGRLSSEFLQLKNSQPGEHDGKTLINIMRQTQMNLMEIIHSPQFSFNTVIETEAKKQLTGHITHSHVEALYCSPVVKKQIWQALQIALELKKTLKKDPNKIFVETTRHEGEKKRTTSRHKQLLELYQAAKSHLPDLTKSIKELNDALKDTEPEKMKRKKLFHYYKQLGRCMYTGRPISLEDLFTNKYDIDHIYPQSLTKDDSFTNTVLVERLSNAEKSDAFPLDSKTRKDRQGLWRCLRRNGLITKEKYYRLTRETPLSEEEKAAFIRRQLVETSQTTKEVIRFLATLFPKSKVVYVKSGNVSDFRRDFSPSLPENKTNGKDPKGITDYSMIKVREINDLHHAKDAYLNIVVGNVYDTKFRYRGKDLTAIVREKARQYHLSRLFLYSTDGAWIGAADENRGKQRPSIETVIAEMRRNSCQVTWEAVFKKGQLWDMNAKSKRPGLLPIKKELSDTAKYGGYQGKTASYFVVVEYENKKGEREKKLESVPIYVKALSKQKPDAVNSFLRDTLGLEKPSVMVDNIKIGSIVEINGARMVLTGNNEVLVFGRIASQLILDITMAAYLKRMFKLLADTAKIKENNVYFKNCGYLDKETNLAVYDTFIAKLKLPRYAQIITHSLYEKMESNRDVFINLSLADQCNLLAGVLPALQCNSQNADLSLLGEGKAVGNIAFSKNAILKKNQVRLVDCSITGLFENSRNMA